MPDSTKRLVAIVGPTGIGKTRMGIRLALLFNGEIVSADSRQIYRYMDIGTAKPTPDELSLVPHHLINVADPDEEFSMARYQELAYQAIDDVHKRGRLPLLVGGSGLYVKAVLEGWRIPVVSPDPEFRYNIEKRAREGEAEDLYHELVGIDPAAAAKIDPRNVRRVIRALEVYAGTGKTFSGLGTKQAPAFKTLIIGLTCERTQLYSKVDRRVDDMIGNGLVGEVEYLVKHGYDFNLPALSGIGYRQIGQYLNGELSLEEASRKIKTETHRFIRHQYAWFRLTDDNIHWYDIEQGADTEIASDVAGFLEDG